jgi:uncharacterized damage-inducible protein DinB
MPSSSEVVKPKLRTHEIRDEGTREPELLLARNLPAAAGVRSQAIKYDVDMRDMLRDLVAHKGHANAALLKAIRESGPALSDPDLWDLLHHILLANRFWLLIIKGVPFLLDHESRPAESFTALIRRYGRTQMEESAWFDTAVDADLVRMIEHPHIPNGRCSVSEALLQVCLHSHGHRAQCATRLRQHGVAPPQMDFILWLKTRPIAEWELDLGSESSQ